MSDALQAFFQFFVDLFSALGAFLAGIGSKSGGFDFGDIVNSLGDLTGDKE